MRTVRAVMSIQSSVVYGHVGSTAAALPLHRLGFDVWALPTVVYSSHAGHRREHGHEVGHGRRRGRTRVTNDRVVEQVGGTGPDRAERRNRRQRPGRDRVGQPAGERQDQRQLQRPHRELPECEHRHREPARREIAAQVREPDAVEDGSGQAGGAAHELAAADPAPRAQHDQHAREAERETEGALARRALVGEGQEHDDEHEEWRRPVPDAREQRRDVLLTEREQRERRAVDEHCGDAEVQPGAPVARQPAALREQHGRQRQQAEEHPAERDLHRGEAAVAELDQHERHAPDASQQQEPCRPGRRAAVQRGSHGRATGRAGCECLPRVSRGCEPAMRASRRWQRGCSGRRARPALPSRETRSGRRSIPVATRASRRPTRP